MRVKISRFIKLYIVPFVVWFLIAIVDFFLNFYPGYLTVITAYILMNYLMLRGFLFLNRTRHDTKSVYVWLDNLDGNDDLLKTLFLNEESNSILGNLELVYKKLIFLVRYDKKKLKLLRGYFKSLLDEGPQDLLNKTILGIAVAIIIWLITKGALWGISIVPKGESFSDINPLFVTVLNFITYIFELFLFLIIFIQDYFRSKKRNRIIIEVLDVCIEEIEEREK